MKSLCRCGAVAAILLSLVGTSFAQTHTSNSSSSLYSAGSYATTPSANHQFGSNPWNRPGFVGNHMPPPATTTQQATPSPSDATGESIVAGESEGTIVMACGHCGGKGCPQCAGSCSSCGGKGCTRCGLFGGRNVIGKGAIGACGVGGVNNSTALVANRCGWFGSVGGLIMTRDQGNEVWLSFDTANPGGQLLGSRAAAMGWAGGFDVRLGRYLDEYSALEAVYWGVFPDESEYNVYDPAGAGQLNTSYAFQALDYQGLGNPIVNWFDGALRHRLIRSHEFHNVELNLLHFGMGAACGPRITWGAGLRYFQFAEGFNYASDDTDTQFTGDADEVYYLIDVENHLIGFQMTGRIDYNWGRRWHFYSAGKIGIYGNHMTHHSFIGGTAGAAVVNDPASPFDGQAYDLNSNRNDVAMAAELDFGINWQMSCRWSTRFGYRAMGIAGLALTTNQIPQNFSDLGGASRIDSNGHMILHGGYLNLQFNY